MIKLLVAGDYVPQNRVLAEIKNERYDKVLGEVKDVLETIDYSVVNLECPLVLSDAKPIRKTGPNLKCTTTKVLDALKWAGFDGVTLANNHFRDYGNSGVYDTLENCKKIGLDTVGGGKDIKEASHVLIKQIKNQSVGIINICEKEYSIATEEKGGSNPLDVVKNYYQIRELKEKCDYVVVITHGGIEHYSLPTPRMQETYRFFVDAGADVVINHHQHCFSGYEEYNEGLIFYGLGNFSFDRPAMPLLWNTGFMIELMLDKGKVEFNLHPYKQGMEDCGIVLLSKEQSVEFEKEIEYLNSVISNSSNLHKEYEKLLVDTEKNKLLGLEPIRNKYVRALQSRKILPRMIKGRALLLNYVRMNCDSHRDGLLFLLEKQIRLKE